MLAIAARAGHRISFGRFVRYGATVSAVTLAVSAGYVYLRYFLLG